jgi:hypothetical protein
LEKGKFLLWFLVVLVSYKINLSEKNFTFSFVPLKWKKGEKRREREDGRGRE